MTTPAHALEPVAQHIEGLSPTQISGELTPLMGYERSELIPRIIAGGEIDPATLVFGAIETAMERVEGLDQVILGERAVKAVVMSMQRGDYVARNVDTALAFFGSAHAIAEGIEDADQKARTITSIAEGITVYSEEYLETSEPYQLAYRAHDYLNDAARTTQDIEDPAERSYVLSMIGTASAKNIEQLAHNIENSGYEETPQQLLGEMTRQPLRVYQEALQVVRGIDDAAARSRAHIEVIRSIVRATSEISSAETYMSGQLVDLAVTQIKNITHAYRGGEYTQMPSAQKSRHLKRLGSGLSAALEQDEAGQLADPDVRTRIIEETSTVFKAASNYAKSIPFFGKVLGKCGIAEGRYGIDSGSSFTALTFAARIVGTNFKTAKEMMVVCYDFASVQDCDFGDTAKRDYALQAIEVQAKERPLIREGFELFSLAYRLAGRDRTGSKQADAQRRTAVHMLEYLGSTRDIEGTSVEYIDFDFVEYTLEAAAAEDEENPISSRQLRALEYLINDFTLKAQFMDTMDVVQAREWAALAPQNRTQEVVQSALKR